ncbi:tumor necrosis factor receptor superfamily member 4 [Podarcis muralis]
MLFSSCSASMKTAPGTATLKLAMKYSLGLALLLIFILPMQTVGGLKCAQNEYPLWNSKCCRKCPAGKELAKRCTVSTDSTCEPCDHGYYNEGYTESRCKRCTTCSKDKGLQEKESCKTTSNTVCTCLPGHFPASGNFGEKICKPCPSGQFLKRGDVKCQSWPE